MSPEADILRPKPGVSKGSRIHRSIRHGLVPAIIFSLLALADVGCQSVPAAEREPPPAELRIFPTASPEVVKVDPAVKRAQDAPAEGDRTPTPSDEPRRGLFGLPRLPDLLDDTPERDSVEFPESRDDPEEPDIRKPGPDTANFPNSAFTLPKGRFYVEASPVFWSGASVGTPKTYNVEFLLRYGLTDRVELRLFGDGPTFERGTGASNGIAPLAYDLKINLWQENEKYFIPAVGIEVFLLTASGSKKLNQGTQPAINLLFDHSLPWDFQLEWNVGIVGDPSRNNNFSSIEPTAAWALQREIFKDFDVFFQGYYNGPTLPRFGDGIELGVGAVWAPTKRIAVFGSYNLGVSPGAPNFMLQIGGAVAF